MIEMTPEKLLALHDKGYFVAQDFDSIRRAASAWEADRKQTARYEAGASKLQDYIETLEAHIEALEKARLLAVSEWSTWKDVLVSNMTEADWRETMDGLRVPAAEEVPDDTHD